MAPVPLDAVVGHPVAVDESAAVLTATALLGPVVVGIPAAFGSVLDPKGDGAGTLAVIPNTVDGRVAFANTDDDEEEEEEEEEEEAEVDESGPVPAGRLVAEAITAAVALAGVPTLPTVDRGIHVELVDAATAASFCFSLAAHADACLTASPSFEIAVLFSRILSLYMSLLDLIFVTFTWAFLPDPLEVNWKKLEYCCPKYPIMWLSHLRAPLMLLKPIFTKDCASLPMKSFISVSYVLGMLE